MRHKPLYFVCDCPLHWRGMWFSLQAGTAVGVKRFRPTWPHANMKK